MSTSRLSSLLVRDGVVGVKRMEQAFQRQVIYGGALDTILLETNALPEERLWAYLSLATGLPAADRDLLEYFDPRAVQVCPLPLAEQYRVAPVALDGRALRVLVTDPVDLSSLEALATALGTPVQPFVVPEYRFHLHLERLFGIPTPSRYAALAQKRSAPAPAPRQAVEPTVVVDDDVVREAEAAARVEPRHTAAMSTDALRAALADHEAKRLAGSAPPVPEPPLAEDEVTPPARRIGIEPLTEVGQHAAASAAAAGPAPQAVPVPEATAAATPVPVPPADAGVVRSPWRGGDTIDPTPIEPREASGQLARAEERDLIFSTLVRAARSRTRYAAVLTVQGPTAFGRIAIDGDEADLRIGQVAVSLEPPSAWKSVLESRSPYIGPVRTGRADFDAALEQLGGVIPPSALLLPVVIRDRTVALVYAHRGADTLSISEVAELLPVAGDAALALSKLILRAKSQGYRRAAETPTPAITTEDLPAKASRPGPAGDWRKAEASPAIPGPRELVQAAGAPSGPISVVVDIIEAGVEPGASSAAVEALARVDELLDEVERRFPGKLWVDRYGTGGRALRASQHGALLALCTRAGPRVVPVLVGRLASDDREVRYYATLALGEVRAPIAVPALAARVFDADYGVRAAAIDALLGYPATDVDAALEPVRKALDGEPVRARAAAHALGELRDVRSIPLLMDSLERDHTTAQEAHRALVTLTKQDFGTKAKKWRAWWDRNRARPRIEWMLDSLAHPDDHVRLSASEELKRLTGEYFGYHFDLPRREREEARQRWLTWWEETGKKRFLRDGREERDRPTAMLPTMPRRGP